MRRQNQFRNVPLKKTTQKIIKNIFLQVLKETSADNEIGTEELQLLFDKKQSRRFRIAWTIVVVVCLSTFFIQLNDRVQYFFNYPKVVNVIEKPMTDEFLFPELKFRNTDTHAFKKYWSPGFFATVPCLNPLQDAINNEIQNFSMTELWRATSSSGMIQNFMKENKFSKRKQNLAFTCREIDTLLGITSTIQPALPLRIDDVVPPNVIVFTFNHEDQQCNPTFTNFIISLESLSDYHSSTLLQSGFHYQIQLGMKKYEMLDLLNKPCTSYEKATRCYNDYIEKQLKDIIHCSFPFLNKSIKLEENCTGVENKNDLEKLVNVTIKMFSLASGACARRCAQYSWDVQLEKNKIPPELTILSLNVGESSRMVTESRAYTVETLFADIGGSLGLFLGLSILSITQIFNTAFFKIKVKSSTTNSHRRNSLKLKIHSLAEKMIVRNAKLHPIEKTSRVIRALQLGTSMACALFSIYLIYDRIVYYCSQPTRVTVDLEEKLTTQYPDLICCGEDNQMNNFKNKLAEERNVSKSDLDTFDLLDFRRYRGNIEKLWNETHMRFVRSLEEEMRDNMLVWYSDVNTFMGHCRNVSSGTQPYLGYLTTLTIAYYQHVELDTWKLFTVPPGDNALHIATSVEEVPFAGLAHIQVQLKKVQRVKKIHSPCLDEIEYRKCRDECLLSKLKRKINCRLPYMPIEMGLIQNCQTPTEARYSQNAYLEVYVKADAFESCNCHIPCKQNVYSIKIFPEEPSDLLPFSASVVSNPDSIIEIIQENEIYNIVALLCDIGNVLGLMMGISVLRVIHLLTYFKQFVKQMRDKTSKI